MFSELFHISCNKYEKYGPCEQDWLEIKENSNLFFQNGPRYCCRNPPNVTVSVDNEMLVLFRSNSGNLDSNGFRAVYEFIGESICLILYSINESLLNI